ncbi:hypothetical protein J4N45_18490 [Vibrio sp. SCSIO 43140]|uniref:hypothetical protein n=1 Tax=Vibrio sp. SCSIO 43140 TaxID=2819100 RepID=UPI002074EEE1|nr:hypothetical protein [Vibrio sp. SCSIO 43140]USD62252.1 hypothetical protein J4N45_18490 [Vibrio sp. SCSIO 43140]
MFLISSQANYLATELPDLLGYQNMRPTPVRFSHSVHRSASMRRRSGFVSAPVAKKVAPSMTLVEQGVRMTSTPTRVVKAA